MLGSMHSGALALLFLIQPGVSAAPADLRDVLTSARGVPAEMCSLAASAIWNGNWGGSSDAPAPAVRSSVDKRVRNVRAIKLTAEVQGTETDPWGNERVALEVRGQLNRGDWNMTFNQALGSGNLLVGEKVKLELDISAIKQA